MSWFHNDSDMNLYPDNLIAYSYVESHEIYSYFIFNILIIVLYNYHIFLQVLRVANYDSDEMSDLPWALARASSKPASQSDLRRNVNRKYRVDELNEPPSRLPGFRSLLPLPGGDLLTGGTDLKIRRWDHYRFCVELQTCLHVCLVKII